MDLPHFGLDISSNSNSISSNCYSYKSANLLHTSFTFTINQTISIAIGKHKNCTISGNDSNSGLRVHVAEEKQLKFQQDIM